MHSLTGFTTNWSTIQYTVQTVGCERARVLSYAVVTTRRTCKSVQSTCKNVGKIWVSVRGEYRLRTDLGARRHTVALLVHGELPLRSGCGRATDSLHHAELTWTVPNKHVLRTYNAR